MANQFLTLVGELAGEAGSWPRVCRCSATSPMMGDTPSRLVARRTCPSGVASFGAERPTLPRTSEPCTVILVNITSVQGGAREPQSGFPVGAGWWRWRFVRTVGPQGLLPGQVLQRFVGQIIDHDGVKMLKTVEVPQLPSRRPVFGQGR